MATTHPRAKRDLRGKMAVFVSTNATWWVMALVAVAALAIGGVHPWTRALLALGALGALAWVWLRYAWQGRTMPIEALGLSLLVALGWTFLQWVPLPSALVELLAPHAVEASTIAAQTAGSSASPWLSMSLAPTRTALGWLTLAGYTAVFLVAADLARRRVGRSLVVAVEVVALATLASGIIHAVADTSAVFGFYEPKVALPGRGFVSVFINPNHAAALMLIGAVVALGRWLEEEARLHLLIAVVLGLGIAATGSRANMGVLVAGWGILLALAWRRPGGKNFEARVRRRWMALFAAAGGGAVLVMALVPGFWSPGASPGAWVAEVASRWDVGLTVAQDYLWTGTGMGAFHTVAASSMPSFEQGLLDHAHNLGLQMVADWGVIATCAIVALALVGFGRCMRAVRSDLGLVALGVALAALVAQNMVDFSLYIPGVGYSAAVLAGVLVGSQELMPKKIRKSKEAGRWPRISLASVGVLALVLATFLTASHAMRTGRDVYHSQAETAIASGTPRDVDIPTLLTHHPHDYYAFRIAGRLALADARPGRARAFLTRAAELAPRHGGIRLDLARASIAENAEVTAVDHLVAAADASSRGRRVAAALVAKWPAASGATAQFIASSPANATAVIYQLQLHGKRDRARAVAERAFNFHRDDVRMWRRVLDMAASERDRERLDGLSKDASKRAVRGTADATEEAARPWLLVSHWARALVLEMNGDLRRAHEAVTEARTHATGVDRARLRLVEASIASRAKDWRALRGALRGLEEKLGSSPARLVRFHQLRARLAEADGQLQVAIAHVHRALVFMPHDPVSRRTLKRLRDKRSGHVAP